MEKQVKQTKWWDTIKTVLRWQFCSKNTKMKMYSMAVHAEVIKICFLFLGLPDVINNLWFRFGRSKQLHLPPRKLCEYLSFSRQTCKYHCISNHKKPHTHFLPLPSTHNLLQKTTHLKNWNCFYYIKIVNINANKSLP